jgi:hypothetical protein
MPLKHYIQKHRISLMALSLSVLMGACTTVRPNFDVATDATGLFSHTAFDRVLRRFVDEHGQVAYTALKKDDADLQAYYAQIATYSPDSHPARFPKRNDRMAYWLNAYNAAVLVNILHHYPIGGVAEVKAPALLFFMPEKSGFFYFHKLVFGSQTFNLYNLEHDLIRPRFNESRLHFALNCGSVGCPRLPQHAFSAATLDTELDRETRLFMAEKRNFRLDHDQRAVYLSEIFQWYESDFLAGLPPGANLKDYIVPYLSPEKAAALKQADGYAWHYTPYDWSLNDQRR